MADLDVDLFFQIKFQKMYINRLSMWTHYGNFFEDFATLLYLQGPSWQSVYSKFALRDRNMQFRFCLEVSVYSWGWEIWVSSTSFQKSNKSWPQQPLKEWLPDISKKLDFWLSIPQKGTGFDHLGARDDLTIRISNFFDKMRLFRPLRPLRLLRLLRSLRLQRL